MTRLLDATAACLLFAGACASSGKTIKVSQTNPAVFSGRTLISVDQDAPGFTPMEPGAAAFGAIGGLAMAAAAETFAQKNGIVDPSPSIEARLMARLASSYALPAGTPVNLKGAKQAVPYPTNPEALYVDAKTYAWQYLYFSFDWGRYSVMYNTLIQLVDGENGSVVGQYDCRKRSHEDAKGAPTKEELLANNSALLNSLLSKMAESCAAEFETEVLSDLPAPNQAVIAQN